MCTSFSRSPRANSHFRSSCWSKRRPPRRSRCGVRFCRRDPKAVVALPLQRSHAAALGKPTARTATSIIRTSRYGASAAPGAKLAGISFELAAHPNCMSTKTCKCMKTPTSSTNVNAWNETTCDRLPQRSPVRSASARRARAGRRRASCDAESANA
jgi:hypothetical protein